MTDEEKEKKIERQVGRHVGRIGPHFRFENIEPRRATFPGPKRPASDAARRVIGLGTARSRPKNQMQAKGADEGILGRIGGFERQGRAHVRQARARAKGEEPLRGRGALRGGGNCVSVRRVDGVEWHANASLACCGEGIVVPMCV